MSEWSNLKTCFCKTVTYFINEYILPCSYIKLWFHICNSFPNFQYPLLASFLYNIVVFSLALLSYIISWCQPNFPMGIMYTYWQIYTHRYSCQAVINQLMHPGSKHCGYIKGMQSVCRFRFSIMCFYSKQSLSLFIYIFYPWPPRAANISWKGNCLWRSFSIMSSHLASPCSLSSSCGKRNIRYKC